jgi:ribosomal protein S12
MACLCLAYSQATSPNRMAVYERSAAIHRRVADNSAYPVASRRSRASQGESAMVPRRPRTSLRDAISIRLSNTRAEARAYVRAPLTRQWKKPGSPNRMAVYERSAAIHRRVADNSAYPVASRRSRASQGESALVPRRPRTSLRDAIFFRLSNTRAEARAYVRAPLTRQWKCQTRVRAAADRPNPMLGFTHCSGPAARTKKPV